MARLSVGVGLTSIATSRRLSAQSGAASWRQVAARGDIAYNSGVAAAGRERIESRVHIPIRQDCTALRFATTGMFVSATNVETPLGNSIDMMAYLEKESGGAAVQPIMAAPVTIGNGAAKTVIADVPASIFGLSQFSKGDIYWLRVRLDCAPGAKQPQFPTTGSANVAGETTFRGATGQSQINGTGLLTGAGLFPLSQSIMPFSVEGLSNAHGLSLLAIGDSIAWGQGDNGGASSGDGGIAGSEGRTTTGGGYVRRACYTLARPLSLVARQATQAQEWILNSAVRAQQALTVTHCLLEYGTNDLAGGARTADQLKADLETIIASLKLINPAIKIYVQTLLPRTASHLSTTPFAGDTQRQLHNARVRAGAVSGAAGFVDIAASVESGVTAGIWADGNDEIDGTHPSSSGHAKMAASLVTAISGWAV